MNSPSEHSERLPLDPTLDSRLCRLLDELADQARAGRKPDLDAVATAHPDLAQELRDLWAVAQIADSFGASFDSVDAPPTSAAGQVAPPATPLPRQFGDYELLEELGRGGMGIVFRARQLSLGRIVALKMVLRGDFASADDLARFRREAEAAAQLNHPHIVPVYEVGEIDGQPYFTMKYIEGTTLAQRLADGPLPPREAAELLLPVCRAIAEAHARGVLHRDLKPSNILIDPFGQPYVSDFGLAKRLSREHDDQTPPLPLTVTGALVGTPGYMAPEQAAGARSPGTSPGKLGAAADVYSLGALLYAMMTGRAPFQAASPLDTALMVLEQDPLPPRFLNQRADPDLEMISLKCLQKPPDLRYRSAAALADDLQAYLANEPISARSSRFFHVVSRAFRETHHASLLENWGLLWMWHSLALVVLCVVTSAFQWSGVQMRWPYVALWSIGLGVWAAIFWNLRRRSGPITFVERQIAHVWAGSVACSTLLFLVEVILDLPVLSLSPVLGLLSGMVFLVKAGILSGAFYIQAAALFFTSAAMALLQRLGMAPLGILLFGVVSGLCFFVPGWKYDRQRQQPQSRIPHEPPA